MLPRITCRKPLIWLRNQPRHSFRSQRSGSLRAMIHLGTTVMHETRAVRTPSPSSRLCIGVGWSLSGKAGREGWSDDAVMRESAQNIEGRSGVVVLRLAFNTKMIFHISTFQFHRFSRIRRRLWARGLTEGADSGSETEP